MWAETGRAIVDLALIATLTINNSVELLVMLSRTAPWWFTDEGSLRIDEVDMADWRVWLRREQENIFSDFFRSETQVIVISTK